MTEIVAEISGNHGGSLHNAIRLIRAAKECGADAVKFQCFDPERLAVKRSGISWGGIRMAYSDLLELYYRTETPREWFPPMIKMCTWLEIPWFSSVFDPLDVEFLERLECPRYKISAYEMLDGDLINAVKATGKPIVMSVRARAGLTILHASGYQEEWRTLGVSDHTANGIVAVGPMAERHIRLPDVETPDADFSSTPAQFAVYVKAIRGAPS